jgi:hypothetical protein
MRPARRQSRNKKYIDDEKPAAPAAKRETKGKKKVDLVEPEEAEAEDLEPLTEAPEPVPPPVISVPVPEPPQEPATMEVDPAEENGDEDNESQTSEPVVTIPPTDPSAESAAWSVPQYSYFDVRSDRDKRLYIECFAEIIGRVKTNYHFRCKGCNESFLGQYLNMLVHMAGTNNHVKARTRACKKPLPEVRARILADFAAYNEKEKQIWNQLNIEPGQVIGKSSLWRIVTKELHSISIPLVLLAICVGCMLLLGCGNMLLWFISTVPPPGRRGRKRSLSNLLHSSFAPGTAGQAGAGAGGPLSGASTPHAGRQSLLRRTSSGGSALWSNVPPGAAVYENSIGGRTNALGGMFSLFSLHWVLWNAVWLWHLLAALCASDVV